MRFPAVAAIAIALVVGQTGEAYAHLVTTGLGPFYDGLMHLIVSPEDIVAVVAITLLAGMSSTSVSRVAVFTLPGAWLVGGVLGLLLPTLPLFPWLTIATFLGLGISIAMNFRLPPAPAACIAIVLGLAHGLMNGSTMTIIAEPIKVLAGIVTSLFVVATIIAAVVASLSAPWTRIGVRVLGSWIAASGVLLLAWALRGIA